jgi:LTXXQ motif family protein
MLHFAVRTGVMLLLVSALTALTTSAGAQNRSPQGRAAPIGRGIGPMVHPATPFARTVAPAPAPHLLPQMVVPRGSIPYGPPPHIVTPQIAAPTGQLRNVAPPHTWSSAEIARARENAVRAAVAAGAQRQLGGNPSSPSFVTGGSSPNVADQPGQASRFIVRQMPGGAVLTGLPREGNRTAIVRGPFLRNPAFAQPSARNDAALALARTTFRGRFADQSRRLHNRTVVIGWVGPLFWPYAYSDFIDYTFWPHAYDSFWPRAYDDVYEGIFGPYAVGATPDADVPLSPGSARPNARLREGDLAQICPERASGLTDWPIERIGQVVEPDATQRAALGDLKDAAVQAVERLQSACPTELPSTPTGRLAAMRMRLEIMLQAVEIVRPALDTFYQSLNDEQKARFNAIGPEEPQVARATQSASQQGSNLTQVCGGQVAKLAELPTARIAEAVRPTQEQRTALDDLDAASMAAGELLKANCREDQALTPPGRLDAMAQRLDAMLQALKTVQPALERFYNLLSDEQKARFNQLGAREG